MRTSFTRRILMCMFFFTISIIHLNSLVLSVEYNHQNQTQWCWAATSRSVLLYYGFDFTQEQIALYGTNGANDWTWLYGETSSPTRRGIDLILMHFASLSSTSYARYFSLSESTTKITEIKPFFVRWGWSSGGGHFVVAHGVSGSTMYLMDPWFGPTINTYSWTVSGSSHTWTHSLAMVNPPAVALPTAPSPANAATNVAAESNISWSNIDAASTVQVFFGTENPPLSLVYSGIPVTSLTNAQLGGPLSSFTDYYWKVNAARGSYSYAGTVWSFRTMLTSLPDIADISINRDGNIVTVTWNPVAGAHSYHVYSSNEPYPVSWGEPIAIVETNQYAESDSARKFYKVVASSE